MDVRVTDAAMPGRVLPTLVAVCVQTGRHILQVGCTMQNQDERRKRHAEEKGTKKSVRYGSRKCLQDMFLASSILYVGQ